MRLNLIMKVQDRLKSGKPVRGVLMLCATGLPLIFHDEIDAALGEDYEAVLTGPPSADAGLPLD